MTINKWMIRNFSLYALDHMKTFIHETALYRNFPQVILKVTDKEIGCCGGIKTYYDYTYPYVQVCIPHINEYTMTGFYEYYHDDPEIGSIANPISWKHIVETVLCHELAHAVVISHRTLKNEELVVPETYHSYSTDMISETLGCQKQFHGKQWQYVYRSLRNQFVNNSLDKFLVSV